MHDYLGLDPLPNVGVKTGGATGGSTLLMGATTIASGLADCTLVLGWERMDEVQTWTGNYYIATAACKDFETRLARNYASYYAPMARRFQEMYHVDERVRAAIAVKNRRYACSSPYAHQAGQAHDRRGAQRRDRLRPVAFPRMLRHECRFGRHAALLRGAGVQAHRQAGEALHRGRRAHVADRRPPADAHSAACPTRPRKEYKRLYDEMEKQDGRWPGFESFGATRMAAYLAYRMAGVKVPIEDLRPRRRPTTPSPISDLQTYGDIGLTLYGEEQELRPLRRLLPTNPHTGKPGKCPANLSGGLLGRCTRWVRPGIFQADEVLWQLQGKYDKFHGDPKMWERYGKKKPADWQSLQVANPPRGGDLTRGRGQPRDLRGPREGLVGGA